jgi:transglutaminase-like putative cysteine protease
MRDRMTYAPGATFVGMDANDVFDQACGVCQDVAHLAIAMHRNVGIPAGTSPATSMPATSRSGPPPPSRRSIQTHAWVEALIPGWGWWGLDPTNPEPLVSATSRSATVATTTYLPLRGVFHGAEEHELGVRVQISRERLSQMQVQQ